MKKKYTLIIAALCICSMIFTGCKAREKQEAEAAPAAGGAGLIMDIPTVQAFTDEAVPDGDIEAIVAAGINAPSAMNGQPWHFTVITDQDILKEISDDMSAGMPGGPGAPGIGGPGKGGPDKGDKPDMGDMPAPPAVKGPKAGIADAPLVIIISCKEGSDLDAGLATQNMSAEAQLLGYGTKIISSPVIALNGEKQAEYKEKLGIPGDMASVSMLLIGKTGQEAPDATTGATERNAAEEMVTYLR